MAINQTLKAIKRAIWIGWKVDSNWADPLLFAIYYLIRPLSGLLIVGFIGLVVLNSGAAGNFSRSTFAYFFLGNTFFIFLVSVTTDMSFLIPMDRNRYEVLKNIYITPSSLKPYMLGRGIMSVIDASLSVLLTFTIAYLIFSALVPGGLGINLAAANYPLLALTLFLGALNWLALGFILSAVNLLSAKLQFTLQEYVIGIFYLFGGVIFAPSVLPNWGQAISNVLPIRYFLAAVRLSFSSCAQDCLPVNTTLLYLAVATLTIVLASMLLFTVAEQRCRRLGLIDQKAEY